MPSAIPAGYWPVRLQSSNEANSGRSLKQQEVAHIIVGLPRSMDGTVGGQVRKVQDFVQELCRCIDVPVEFRDERLTTVSARRLMKSGSRKSRKKVRYDAAAAAIILQSYLEEGR